MKKFSPILIAIILMALSSTTVFAGNPWKQMKKVEKDIVPPKFPKRYFVVTDYYNGTDSLFTDAINLENISLPEEFWAILGLKMK